MGSVETPFKVSSIGTAELVRVALVEGCIETHGWSEYEREFRSSVRGGG